MQFNSTLFLFYFLPLVLLVYMALPKTALRNGWLLIMSLLFYGWCNPKGLLFLAAYAIVNYGIVRFMDAVSCKKLWLFAGILADLCVLYFFKYFNFTLSIVRPFLQLEPKGLSIVQPMGISFLTFTTISYVVDVYRGKAKPIRRFTDFLLYLSFFPKAAQGPIVRVDSFCTQISSRSLSFDQALAGLRRFIVGLSKKCLIADVLGRSVDLVFSNVSVGISPTTAWIAVFYYTLQIYYDFSGYTDMAIGISQVLGFSLPENFRTPYRSVSVSEFWRRWHITLGQWFKDYLYIPLGGNRRGLPRTFFNLGIVWLATGIWHGAAYNYILWGIYYGILIMAEKAISSTRFYAGIPRPIKWACTFLSVMIGWVMFRSGTLTEMAQYFAAMLGRSGGVCPYGLRYYFDLPSLLALITGIFFLLPVSDRMDSFFNRSDAMHWVWNTAHVVLLLISVVYMVNSSYTSFIYFQF